MTFLSRASTLRSATTGWTLMAAISFFSSCPRAEAAIVYSGPVNFPNPVSGLYFDFENPTNILGSSSTFGNTWDVNLYFDGTNFYNPSRTGLMVSGDNARNLSAGTLIGPGTVFSTSDKSIFNVVTPANSSTYFGFRFTPNTSGGAAPLYGWVQIAMSSQGNGAITGIAYETSGGAIAAGAIPEPSSGILLAAGALGLTARRRRRRSRRV